DRREGGRDPARARARARLRASSRTAPGPDASVCVMSRGQSPRHGRLGHVQGTVPKTWLFVTWPGDCPHDTSPTAEPPWPNLDRPAAVRRLFAVRRPRV